MAKLRGRLFMMTVFLIAGAALGITGASSDTKPRPRYPDEDIGADSLPRKSKRRSRRRTIQGLLSIPVY